VYVLKGRSNRGPSPAAGLVPRLADEAAAAAARDGRSGHRAAAADHHRAGHRQRHVRHQAQSTAEGHLLRTEVTPTSTLTMRYTQSWTWVRLNLGSFNFQHTVFPFF